MRMIMRIGMIGIKKEIKEKTMNAIFIEDDLDKQFNNQEYYLLARDYNESLVYPLAWVVCGYLFTFLTLNADKIFEKEYGKPLKELEEELNAKADIKIQTWHEGFKDYVTLTILIKNMGYNYHYRLIKFEYR
jgi:hypothetical protein